MPTNSNFFHVTKDPVHGTMQFNREENNWIKPFIDSPNFQRLRHIKQLGMGDYIFPGAVHSRFNHSLGCCYVASQIAQKIGLNNEDHQLVIIACLLHDIGHGPFSHAFEDIFFKKIIRHEDWTPYFLRDYTTVKFFQIFNERNSHYQLTEEKFNKIAQMIMHKPLVKNILADIVSSQLDADRLDYLLRDSHFCGVRYGEFDFHWMLHCMAIVKTDQGERLGITHKGIGVVEHYLMARRLMTRNIYHLQKKLALEFFMVKFLANLAENLERYSTFADIQQTRLGQFLIAVDRFNKEKKPENKNSFLEANYQNYKELCDYDLYILIKQLAKSIDPHPAAEIARRLYHRMMPKIYRLDKVDISKVEKALIEFKHTHAFLQDWQISIIKTPHQSYTKEEPILVINEKSIIQPISYFSFTIDALSDRTEHLAFICVDSEIADNKQVLEFLNCCN